MPPDPLTRFVAGSRQVTRSAPRRSYVRLPDGGVDLVVRVGGGDVEVLVGGARHHAFRKVVDDAPESLLVRFRPGGAYPFFGVPLSELTDRFVSIERLWPEGRRLREQLAAAGAAARLPIVEAALIERLRGGALFEPSGAPAVRRALSAIGAAAALPRVSELSGALGISPRQLRRTFDAVVGITPKTYLRVLRFQRAVHQARRAEVRDWSAIAAATGYYDQAHLIAEFRDLAGVTPEVLLRGDP